MIKWIPYIPGFVQADPSDYEPKYFNNFEDLKDFLLEENAGFLNDDWKLVYEFNIPEIPAICIMVVSEGRTHWWVRGYITNYNENEKQQIEKDSLFHKFVKWIENTGRKMEIEE